MQNISKILIVKPSSLGDVVHSLPFLASIKKCFKAASIDWVISRGLHELLEGHPMIDKLWTIDKDSWKNVSKIMRTIRELITLGRSLRNERYDLVIDLQGLLRSGIISRMTHSNRIIGFGEAREGSRFFYNERVTGGKESHAVERYLRIASHLGCEISDIEFPFTDTGDNYALKDKFPIPSEYCVVVPGGRWETKRWAPERFGQLISRLSIKAVILGSSSEKAICGSVAASSNGNALDLAGRTSLKEMISIIRGAKFVLTNDTGPMHIAAALDRPVFAIFGPTSEVLTGPFRSRGKIIRSDTDCAPCFRRKCEDMKCLDDIDVNTVEKEIRSFDY